MVQARLFEQYRPLFRYRQYRAKCFGSLPANREPILRFRIAEYGREWFPDAAGPGPSVLRIGSETGDSLCERKFANNAWGENRDRRMPLLHRLDHWSPAESRKSRAVDVLFQSAGQTVILGWTTAGS